MNSLRCASEFGTGFVAVVVGADGCGHGQGSSCFSCRLVSFLRIRSRNNKPGLPLLNFCTVESFPVLIDTSVRV